MSNPSNQAAPSNQPSKDVIAAFEKALNEHGYAFQHSVIRKALTLLQSHKSTWVFESIEVPVAQGSGTRIDFVLRRNFSPLGKNLVFYMLAECKRANPAYSNWVFARAPYANGRKIINTFDNYFFEHLTRNQIATVNPTILEMRGIRSNVYNVAVEVKTNKPGDSYPINPGKGVIEEAATQISRGLNGFIDLLAKNFQIVRDDNATLLPVVFTTANLWTTDGDMSTANIETGEVDFSSVSYTQQKWLAFQYHLSPGLKHGLSYPGLARPDLGSFVDQQFVRTILIINSLGIEDFLQWSSFVDFSDYM